MRWKSGRRSAHVEDRRGRRAVGMGVGGLGIGGLVLVLAVWLLGGDPAALLGGGGAQAGAPRVASAQEDERADFVSVVLADTEDVWRELFSAERRRYQPAELVLFTDAVDSACGTAGAAVGPFYCPLDGTVYLDLGFFEELARGLGAPGDFAQAYVVAHEVGHHVQRLLGTSERVRALQGRAGEAEANDLSVRLELQADFYAGVWAHHAQRAREVLEPGDLDEALRAASRIGDDWLQRRGRGRVQPETFTHGTSAQRARWFRRGFESGDPSAGDTFAAREL